MSVILYYEHDKRRIVIDEGKKEHREISIERAKKYVDDDEVMDYNIAFHRLIVCDWDMDKVERQYESEKNDGK